MPVNDNKKQNIAFEESQDLTKGEPVQHNESDSNNKRDTINSENFDPSTRTTSINNLKS